MQVQVFEVGLRDGLQNEKRTVALRHKLELARGLLRAGVRDLELGAFVRAERVPQMADSAALFQALESRRPKRTRARLWALVPNARGLERARAAGVGHVAVFTATSESFNRRNIEMSVEQSLRNYAELIPQAHQLGMKVRGYVSTVWGCPFEGAQRPARAVAIAERLFRAGVQQVSLGDTIGVGDPRGVERVLGACTRAWGGAFVARSIAVHFHDTRGTALANVLRSLDLGVRIVDASVGGLGGCPFAPGAAGNLATEDLLYLLDGMGVRTGIDLKQVARASVRFHRAVGRVIASKYLQAYLTER